MLSCSSPQFPGKALVDGAAVGTTEGRLVGILVGTLVDGADVRTIKSLSVGFLIGSIAGALVNVDDFTDVGFDKGFADVGFDEGFADVGFDVDGFPVDGDIMDGYANVGFDDGVGNVGLVLTEYSLTKTTLSI